MRELIYRQAAIDAINSWRGRFSEEYNEAIDDCENSIKELPIIQPEPQWIPVESKMPEDMQFVLLTVRRLKNGYNHEPFISVGYIGWNHQHWWCAHDGDCEISKVEVLAWMPLPKPFEGGTE